MARTGRRALMGLMFFPRGGSAQAARSLARELPEHGWDVTVLSGSLGRSGDLGNAERFYSGLDVRAVDFSAAVDSDDPLRADPPMHPSFEDRTGAPDPVFASVDDETFEHLVEVWSRELLAAAAREADVLHLHHLTPLNEAAARVAPDVPVVAHIHGTELLMLEAIESGAPGWAYGEEWAERMRAWARSAARIFLPSLQELERAYRLLGVDGERCVGVPNGFDPAIFDRRRVDRAAHWRRTLVEDPRGWRPGQKPGSVAYTEEQLEPLESGTTLLYVGRFTAVKRIGMLIRAYDRARAEFRSPAPLVLVGGYVGEWEGEHPIETIETLGVPDVYLAGWHEHEDLPDFLAASDAVVMPSRREKFGLVLVEGMACGLPGIAAAVGGPAEIVDDGETGWLIPPDDEEALAAALVETVNDPDERRRRGKQARAVARERYSLPAIAESVASSFEEVAAAGRR